MTSVGDKQSSLCPDGETEAEAPLIFGKGGASHQLLQSIHLPHEGVSGTGVPSRPPLRAYIHQDIAASSWVTWAQSPSTPDTAQEHPPPPQLLEGVLGSGGCSPSLLSLPAHVLPCPERLIFSTWPLFLHTGSSGVQQGRRQPRGTEDLEASEGSVVVLCSPCNSAWAHRGGLSRHAGWRRRGCYPGPAAGSPALPAVPSRHH